MCLYNLRPVHGQRRLYQLQQKLAIRRHLKEMCLQIQLPSHRNKLRRMSCVFHPELRQVKMHLQRWVHLERLESGLCSFQVPLELNSCCFRVRCQL